MEKQQKWWAAVLQRDGNFDGRFVYAVRSTGVYGRPTCPSRRPTRPQVVFFPGAGAAEQAGFRPCRRCRPEERTSGQSKVVGLVRDACRFIEQNYAEGVDLLALSTRFNVSASHLHRMFKRTLGVSPAQYANACRVNSVKTSLRNGSDVTSAIYEAGFGSSSRLYERRPSEFGMTPASRTRVHAERPQAANPLDEFLRREGKSQ